MVGLLPRTLLLTLVTLNKLSKFRCPGCHGTFSTNFLIVVGLCFLLKLLDNLVLLTQLEVEVTKLILQDSSKIVFLFLRLCVRLGL